MKNSKPIFYLVILCTLFLITGCKGKQEDEKKTVMTTDFVTYDMARTLLASNPGGIEVDYISSKNREINEGYHEFTPTKEDKEKIANADAFIYIGGLTEQSYLSTIKKKNRNRYDVCLMDVVKENLIQTEDGEDDEHIYMSVKNGKECIRAIADVLVELDKKNEDFYREAMEQYFDEMDSLSAIMEEKKRDKIVDTIVIGDRNAFSYLCKEYGISVYSPYDGCHHKDTAFDKDKLKEAVKAVDDNRLHTIFYTDGKDGEVGSLADELAKRTIYQSQNIEYLYCMHDIHYTTERYSDSYLNMMKYNIEAIGNALQDVY